MLPYCEEMDMKIVIAPDSFKESLTAEQAAKAIQSGFMSIFPDSDYYLLPIADGGEGTIQALASANGGIIEQRTVTGPLNQTVDANIAFSKDEKTAFIEMAEACGLHLVPLDQRDPLQTTTFGVGELIQYALDRGVDEIIIGVGGSSTNDGGTGMASALGYKFFDETGALVQGNGQGLSLITSLSTEHVDKRLGEVTITIAGDVVNRLTGPSGATYVFGPQKGLPEHLLKQVDQSMVTFYKLAEETLGRTVSDIPGSGAGGGIGAGLMLFAHGKFKKGIDLVLDQLNISKFCEDADIVIVGEGKMDEQTIYGKAPIGVARRVPENTKVIAICGSIGEGTEILYEHGIDAIFPTIPSLLPLETIMGSAYTNVERTARNVAALLKKE